jgi:hypothetical protein
MSGWERDRAIDRVEDLVETVETEQMPVPVREVWVYGDLALGLDPVDRLDIYVTKDLLFGRDSGVAAEFEASHGIKGIGKTVRAEWAETYPGYLRANPSGHVTPERCLAAHLLEEGEPVHLEVCNASFEDNVTQRLKGATARGTYQDSLTRAASVSGSTGGAPGKRLRSSRTASSSSRDCPRRSGCSDSTTNKPGGPPLPSNSTARNRTVCLSAATWSDWLYRRAFICESETRAPVL